MVRVEWRFPINIVGKKDYYNKLYAPLVKDGKTLTKYNFKYFLKLIEILKRLKTFF